MIKQIGTVTMYVRDQEEALRFYTEKLGFEKRADQEPFPGFRWLTVAPPGATTQFLLLRPDQTDLPPKLAQQAEAEIGFAPHFVLEADDIQATYQDLSNRGVEFTQPPTQQPWGMTMAQLKDLYGNVIVLVQADEAARAQGQG